MNNYSDKILEFATQKHEGQFRKYGSNLPYISHPIAVAKIAIEDISPNRHEMIKSIAYLHDTLEDTNATIEELIGIVNSATNEEPDITDTIVTAVQLLTKPKNQFKLIEDYLYPIKCNELARIVKLADLQHNMSDLKVQKKLDYYKLISYYLTSHENY